MSTGIQVATPSRTCAFELFAFAGDAVAPSGRRLDRRVARHIRLDTVPRMVAQLIRTAFVARSLVHRVRFRLFLSPFEI